MRNTSQIKNQLLKSMTDEQLAKTIISMQAMSNLFSDKDKTRVIEEVISRPYTTEPVLLAIQEKIVDKVIKSLVD